MGITQAQLHRKITVFVFIELLLSALDFHDQEILLSPEPAKDQQYSRNAECSRDCYRVYFPCNCAAAE